MKLMKPGPLTDSDREVISDFQEKYGLFADGKVGHQTWNFAKNTIDFLHDGIEELQCLVEDAESRANDLANENERLMQGIEDQRGSDCIGCVFTGILIGMFFTGLMFLFF
jgi:tetrahydromethanopterin S-methyltransferase subunit F